MHAKSSREWLRVKKWRSSETMSRSLRASLQQRESSAQSLFAIIGDWKFRGVDDQSLGKGFSGRGRKDSKIEDEVYRVLRSGPEMLFQVLLKGRSPVARGEQSTGDVTRA